MAKKNFISKPFLKLRIVLELSWNHLLSLSWGIKQFLNKELHIFMCLGAIGTDFNDTTR